MMMKHPHRPLLPRRMFHAKRSIQQKNFLIAKDKWRLGYLGAKMTMVRDCVAMSKDRLDH